MEFELKGQRLRLLPQKAIYWEEQNTLLLADTHLGKVTHFRKAGIALPGSAAEKNLLQLHLLFEKLAPKKVYFLGDLFHSELNSEWFGFKELLKKFPGIEYHLIQGNHDILHEISYQNSNFSVYETPLELDPFILSHEPLGEHEKYNLCGHIHPGVTLRGKGRQSLTLPCFYFGKQQGIMPAFGVFTGLHKLSPGKEDQIFVVANDMVLKVN